MPTGSISYTTLASSAVNNANETRFYLIPVDAASLRTGTNLLAMEIHQSGTNSSDIAFDLALQAERLQPPRLEIALGSGEVQLSWPSYAEGLNLYFATNLISPASWNTVAKQPVTSNNVRAVTLPVPPNGSRFYRLQTP